jgi:hypothetical protein
MWSAGGGKFDRKGRRPSRERAVFVPFGGSNKRQQEQQAATNSNRRQLGTCRAEAFRLQAATGKLTWRKGSRLSYNQTNRPIQEAAREMIVLELYRRGTVSDGKAAELLGMPLLEFIRHASSLGIPHIDMTPDEWEAEKAVLDAWPRS